MGAWVPHVPDRARELHLDPGTLGWALLASGLGAVLAMPLAGRMTARLGSRAVSRVSGIAFPVTLSAVTLAPTAWLMTLALLCFGIAGASMDVAMNAQGIAVEEQLGERTISRLHGMWSIGGFVGSAITSFALSRQLPAWIIVLSFSVLIVLLVAAATQSLFSREEEGLHEQPHALRPHGQLLLLGLVAFVSMVCEGSIADWSGLYLRVVRDAGLGVSGYGYAAFAALMVTGRLSGDSIVARYGEERTLLAGGLLGCSRFGSRGRVRLAAFDERAVVAAWIRAGGRRTGQRLAGDLPDSGPRPRCARRRGDCNHGWDWLRRFAGRAAGTWLRGKACRTHIDPALRHGAVLCDGVRFPTGARTHSSNGVVIRAYCAAGAIH